MSFPPVSFDDLVGVFVLAMAIEDGMSSNFPFPARSHPPNIGVVVCRLVRAKNEDDVKDENGVASVGEFIDSLVDEHPFALGLLLFATVAQYVVGLLGVLGVLLCFISATT